LAGSNNSSEIFVSDSTIDMLLETSHAAVHSQPSDGIIINLPAIANSNGGRKIYDASMATAIVEVFARDGNADHSWSLPAFNTICLCALN
jgi:hypothetical protein